MAMAGPASSSRRYDYKKPSSFNFVSFFMLLALLAGGYWAFKFGPVYYKRFKVDEAVQESATEATGIRRLNPAGQEQLRLQVEQRLRERLEQRGLSVEANRLSVYFDANFARLHADYDVTVRHPVGKPTTVKMRRKASVPE